MVVAHPDDEALFGGGQLLLEDNWKVVCLTNGDNSIRRKEFEQVMYVVGATFEMWNYHDQFEVPLDDFEPVLRKIMTEPFKKIVTHNAYGEYGHPHHKQIHNVMRRLVGEDLYVFHLKGTPLPDDIWEEKKNLVGLYLSQKEICDGHLPNTRRETITQYKGRITHL